MTSPDARSEAARELNRARWGNQVVSRAASVIVERADELTDDQVREVAAAIAKREDAADE